MAHTRQDHLLMIRNMVCDRCIATVKQDLEQVGLPWRHVGLGEVELARAITPEEKKQLATVLADQGFELLEDRTTRIVNRIKVLIMEQVRSYQPGQKIKLSEKITDDLHQDYHQLSTLFSSVEGTTIERYAILQRIEYVKELLFYGELTLSEIADKLGYSSVAHLSGQFKRITGLTPSGYKKLRTKPRQQLDKL